MAETALLPLNEDPPVRGYLRHAFLFSILSTDDIYLPWLFGGNYTQLVFDRDPGWMPLDFYTPLGYSGSGFACPFLDAQWIGRTLIEGGYGSLVPFLTESIDEGYYARLTVDEFYLPGRTSYRRRHFMHSLLVHGYDRGRGLFLAAGYLANGEYGSTRVSFTELEEAFAVGLEPLESEDCDRGNDGSGSDTGPRRFDGVGSRADLRRCMHSKRLSNVESNRVWLVRYNREARFELDFGAALEMLEDYANSARTPSRFASILTFPNKVYTLGQTVPEREDLTFGVETYGCLQWWMEEVLRGAPGIRHHPLPRALGAQEGHGFAAGVLREEGLSRPFAGPVGPLPGNRSQGLPPAAADDSLPHETGPEAAGPLARPRGQPPQGGRPGRLTVCCAPPGALGPELVRAPAPPTPAARRFPLLAPLCRSRRSNHPGIFRNESTICCRSRWWRALLTVSSASLIQGARSRTWPSALDRCAFTDSSASPRKRAISSHELPSIWKSTKIRRLSRGISSRRLQSFAGTSTLFSGSWSSGWRGDPFM